MPSISANTLITLPARQLLIFSSGGTGVAQVSGITGGPVSYVVGLYESYVGPYDRETSVYVTGSVWPITYTIDTDGVLPTLNDLAVRLTAVEASGGGGGVADDAVTNAKLANVATATIKGRATAGTGDPEDLTAAQVRTLLNVANGATANSADATLLARANHTGTQTASTISDFNSAARAQVEAELIAGSNVTITPGGSGATRTLTIAASGGAGATNLSYTAATRVIASDTGTDATLPLVSSTDAGLAPASGGGTTNFLRADGTWAAPSGGSGVTDGDKGDITVSASGATWTLDNDVVTNAKAANMATATIKGRATAGTGDPEDLTASQVKTLLAVGISDVSGLQTALDGKLSENLATDITTAKTSFSNSDKGILLDAAASDAPKTFTGAVMRTTPVGSSLGTTGTVNLDFAALVGTLQTISATGNITFTASNYAAGLEFELRIDANGGTRTLAYPATWKAYGAALPTSLASGKVLTLAIRSTGTTEGAVDATSALSV